MMYAVMSIGIQATVSWPGMLLGILPRYLELAISCSCKYVSISFSSRLKGRRGHKTMTYTGQPFLLVPNSAFDHGPCKLSDPAYCG